MVDMNNVWPGWRTVRIIGHGSFGTVYEIERDVFGHIEKAALKVISIPQNRGEIEELYNDGYDEDSITQRFESYLKEIVREYSLMSEMKGHTNIVYCDDLRYIQHDDGLGWDIYIKMELLTPLPKILENGFSEKLVVKVAVDMCNALILCRSKNIVHRDIKPQNIFVSEDKNFKLGDFGIAKTAEHTTSGTKTGTYKYMAPEVYNNQPYGAAADIYSLGMVLYWLLNERRTPFLPLPPKVPTSHEEDYARNTRFSGKAIPVPAHGSAGLKRIVLKACAYNPEDRYRDAQEMRQDLKELVNSYANGMATESVSREVIDYENNIHDNSFEDETIGVFGRDNDGTISERTISAFHTTGKYQNKQKKKGSLLLSLIGVLGVMLIVGFSVGVLIAKVQGNSKVEDTVPDTDDIIQAIHETTRATSPTTVPETILETYIPVATSPVETIPEETAAIVAPIVNPNRVVDIAIGNFHVVALYEDGTVDAIPHEETYQRQHPSAPYWDASGVKGWTDIVAISAGYSNVVGLRADGTVVSVGRSIPGGYDVDVSSWTDITKIDTGTYFVVGLKSDGTVVSTGNTGNIGDISNLANVVDIFVGANGGMEYLLSDGTWIRRNTDGTEEVLGVYQKLKQIYSFWDDSIGVFENGNIVVARSGKLPKETIERLTDVVEVTGGIYTLLALKSDGTVCVIGTQNLPVVEHWSGIRRVISDGGNVAIGIKNDGALIISGNMESFDIGSLNRADVESEGIHGRIAHTDSGVNVRSGPGTSYEQVAKVPSGRNVTVYEMQENNGVVWGRTMYGWISMDYFEAN